MNTIEAPMIPAWFLPITGVALACVIGLSAVSRLTATPPVATAPIASASLLFADQPDGTVLAMTATGAKLAIIPARQNGFLRMTLHLMVGLRQREDKDSHAPFTVAESAAHHYVLSDPQTGQTVELEAFGPSNVAPFAAILKDAAK
jgi:putative photosynthetic complex assembly protein